MTAIKGSGTNTAASTFTTYKYTYCSSRQQHCLTCTVIAYKCVAVSLEFLRLSSIFYEVCFCRQNVACTHNNSQQILHYRSNNDNDKAQEFPIGFSISFFTWCPVWGKKNVWDGMVKLKLWQQPITLRVYKYWL